MISKVGALVMFMTLLRI